MSQPDIILDVTRDQVNDSFRRVAANTLEVSAQEIDLQIHRKPDPSLDEGRKWAVLWLQTIAKSMRNEEEKDHDRNIAG